MKKNFIRSVSGWTFFAFLLLLTACTGQKPPEESESLIILESKRVSESSEESRVLGSGDGWLEEVRFYQAKDVFPLFVAGDQYRLDVNLERVDSSFRVDMSMFDSPQIYAMVSFDGFIPHTMKEAKNKIFTIPVDNGCMPGTISLSLSSDTKAFDNENEAILQEFIHGKRDRLNASVYLFAPDGDGIEVLAGILLPENILTGMNTIHAKAVAKAAPVGDAPIHVRLIEENGASAFDVQFDCDQPIPSDAGDSYYLQLNASDHFPYRAVDGESVQRVPLIKTNAEDGKLEIKKEEHYRFPIDTALTKEQRLHLEDFLAHPDTLGFPLSISLHDQLGRILRKAIVYMNPVQ